MLFLFLTRSTILWLKVKYSQYCTLLNQILQWTQYLKQTIIFNWKTALWKKFNYYFSWDFCLVLTNCSFWDQDWAVILHFGTFLIFPNFLSLKSFSNSWGNWCIPCLLLLITLRFTCSLVVKWKFDKVLKSQNIMTRIVCSFFFFLSLLTAPIVKNRHILKGIYFTFLKQSLRQNLKVFQ